MITKIAVGVIVLCILLCVFVLSFIGIPAPSAEIRREINIDTIFQKVEAAKE